MTATLTEAYQARLDFYRTDQPRAKNGEWTSGGAARGSTPGKVWTGLSADPHNRSVPKAAAEAVELLKHDPERLAKKIYEGDIGGGVTAVVTDVSSDDFSGTLTLAATGVLMKGDKQVGTFVRTMLHEGGVLSVNHSELYVDDKYQSAGIADRFNAKAIAEYQHIGVDHISLQAADAVGAYAWARQGFRYNESKYNGNRQSRKEFNDEVLSAIKLRAEHVPNLREHSKQLLADIRALKKASDAGEDIQPIHLASIGEKYAKYETRTEDGRNYITWPGKESLLGRRWYGAYYFDAAKPVTAAATSLEHAGLRPATGLSATLTEALACHTAACRPPSSGGTGGSLRQHALPDVAPGDVRFSYRPRHPDGHADPGEIVWAHVPFEDNPSQGKDRPVLIVGRTESGNLVGVQLSTKGHHKGSFPVEWGTEKQSFLRPERFIQVDASNYRKEGAYVKKPKFQDIVDTVTKFHRLSTQTFVTEVETFACHSASCRPPTSGGTGGSSKKGSAGFDGLSPGIGERVTPDHKIYAMSHEALDEVGWGEEHLDLKTRTENFVKSWFETDLPGGATAHVRVVKLRIPVSVEGELRSATGQVIGHFERTIDWNNNGKTVVNHEWLDIAPDHQGKGIADAFNKHSLEAYHKYGVDRIETHAGLTVGGYTWAVAGFRFDRSEPFKASSAVAKHAQQRLNHLENTAQITMAQHKRLSAELDALIKASEAGEDVQPVHIASIGRDTPLEHNSWPGKEMMLGSNWKGVYYLGDPLTASAALLTTTFRKHRTTTRRKALVAGLQRSV